MRCKEVFVFIFIIFLISFSSASFILSEEGSSINNQYDIPDYLKASINISFQNESLSSIFTDSLGNSITLKELLDITSGYSYEFNDNTDKTIDSEFQILEFNQANFSMPSNIGNFTYQLNFSGVQIFKKTFEITSIGNSVKEEIDKKYAEFNASKTEIKKYDLSIQNILNKFLNITFIEDDLNKIEIQYESARSDEEYNQVLENLSSIKIPEQISENINTNPIIFYPNRELINLDVLKSIAGGDYDENEQGYIDAMYLWNENNLGTKLTFKEMLINYGLNEESTLKIFEFEFDKTNLNSDAYFIIKDINDLKFEEGISPIEESGYSYINLNNISDKIIFSTTENVDFLSVPAFISPSLNNLEPATVGPYSPPENLSSKWILFGVIAFLLLLVAIVIYVILQAWYRRKYENSLFKNRNNLYNIMTYIQSSKKRGMERDDIMKDLKKAGWTREQINYAIRKYEGKKILGIIQRPFKKVLAETERKF